MFAADVCSEQPISLMETVDDNMGNQKQRILASRLFGPPISIVRSPRMTSRS